ncbi:MAG: exported protein of unknown function [Nitrospira sp.]|jgi:hypothetical protein|nr:exported protein of unknown function [Nitrospira sp.]
MQKQKTKLGIMLSTAVGLMWLSTVPYVNAAEPSKKPTEQAGSMPADKVPPVKKKAPATKAPEKRAAPKGGGQKANASAPKASSPAPRYSSAETADKSLACFGEAPKIEAVQPDEGKAGDKVTIMGRGFGPAECLRSLSFGPGHPATFRFETDSKITTTVPSGSRKGLSMMTVTTASGEDSKVFVVK